MRFIQVIVVIFLEVFCIFDGEIEIFDLSKVPIERSQYDLCDNRIFNKGYLISNRCIACDRCKRECPQQCIKSGSSINNARSLFTLWFML